MSNAERGATAPRPEAPLLKLLLEVGPLTAFFFANSRFGIFTATGVFMAATVIALTLSYILHKRIPIMPLVSGAVVMVFGGLTLFLHDDLFIKLKPTIVNSLFATVLLGGLLFGKSLLGYVFDSVFQLTEAGWRALTLRWGLFFIFLAVLNEIVWRGFTTDFWVGFKLWGVMPITIAFALAQVPLIQRTSLSTDDDAPAEAPVAGSGRGAGE
jgi:intracellular septation protein